VSVLRVGLTGGLASGKSTVGRRLAAAGATVVDADRVVQELYRAGEPGAAAVAAALGPEFLTPDGEVDRAAVAKLVFADRAALERLEKAIHPLVGRRFEEIAARSTGIVVLEATKLVESGLDRALDVVVTVEAPLEARLRRAKARGLSEAEARTRIAAQDDGTLRRQRARFVIENRAGLDELSRRVDRLVGRLRREVARRDRRDDESPRS
jgi:dephospho-CoA kinase